MPQDRSPSSANLMLLPALRQIKIWVKDKLATLRISGIQLTKIRNLISIAACGFDKKLISSNLGQLVLILWITISTIFNVLLCNKTATNSVTKNVYKGKHI